VTGGSGALGLAALRAFDAEGHEATAVVRSAGAAERVRAGGATATLADLDDLAAITAAATGHDALVNLLTHIPVGGSAALSRSWAANDHLRSHTSRVLATAAARAEVPRLVQESVAFVYPDCGDELIDEDTPIDPDQPLRSTLAATAHALAFDAAGGVGVVLRLGRLYGDDAASRAAVVSARRRLPSLALRPDAWTSWLTLDDAGWAVEAALRAPGGVWNVAATPVRGQDALAGLARAAGVSAARPLPALAARAAGGRVEALLRSQRVDSSRFRQATGWVPVVDDIAVGWPGSI